MTDAAQSSRKSGAHHALQWFGLSVGILGLMFGFLLTCGFMGKNSGVDGSDMGLSVFVLGIFYLIPLMLIGICLKKLRAQYQLSGVAIAGVMFFGACVFTGSAFVKTYNGFVQSEENINQAFTNVDMAYQKRFNLISNLDAASRRYQEHERSVIKDIVDARKSVLAAATPSDKISKFGQFDMAARGLMVNIEQYPNLKADQLVQTLMKEITATENELLELKTVYNARVTDFNKSVRVLPYSLIARPCGFASKQVITKDVAGENIYDASKLLASR